MVKCVFGRYTLVMKPQREVFQVSLKVFLRNTKGEFLLLKARPQDTYGGFYDLPGGRIDVHERATPFPEIVQRELHEEIGAIQYTLQPRPVALGRHTILAKYTSAGVDTQVFYVFFEAQYKGGDIQVSDEHVAYAWVDLAQEAPEKYLLSGNLEGVKTYLAKE